MIPKPKSFLILGVIGLLSLPLIACSGGSQARAQQPAATPAPTAASASSGQSTSTSDVAAKPAEQESDAMTVQFVKFKSGLSDQEVRQNIEERGPQFRALSGIIQKFYVQEKDTGEWAGIYIWDSQESMQAFRGSDLAKAIPGVYKVEGTPRVEIFELYKPLRSEVPEPAFNFK